MATKRGLIAGTSRQGQDTTPFAPVIQTRLVRCIQCNALALFSSLDQCPEYRYSEGKWIALDRDDQVAFTQMHGGHRLEELHIIDDSFISRKDYIEPTKTTYFEAGNGIQRFLIKKSREEISEPQRYELVPGKLRIFLSELRIEEDTIEEELKKEFSPGVLSSQKINYFVRQLGRVVSRMDPEKLKRVPYESHNPSVWYFYLDKETLEKGLTRCASLLNKKDLRRIRDFIYRILDDEFLFATAKVDFQIVEVLETRKERISKSRSPRNGTSFPSQKQPGPRKPGSTRRYLWN